MEKKLCGRTLSEARYSRTAHGVTAMRTCCDDGPYAFSEWCINVPMQPPKKEKDVVLFGCTEDIQCERKHDNDTREHPFCRRLCEHCAVPVCSGCRLGLDTYDEKWKVSTVPMALANDNYYGYISSLLVSQQVTWLECACANLVWSTILV